MRGAHWVAAALAFTCSAQARADVVYYNLFRAQRFTQTGAAPPQSPDSYDCELRVDDSDQATMDGGTVTWTSAQSPGALTYYGTVGPLLGGAGNEYAWQWSSPSFDSQSDLDTACPAESYSFSISGGSAGDATATLTGAADAWTDTIPALDADSWAALASFDPTQDQTLQSVGHDGVEGTNFSGSWLKLSDSDGNVVSSSFAQGGAVSLDIPANTLAAGADYQVQIFFSDRALTSNAGFGAATADSSFDLSTSIRFTTAGMSGQVYDYNVYKQEHYVQTAATPPVTPAFYYCNLGLDDDAAADFTNGAVTWGGNNGYSPVTLSVSGTAANTIFYWWPGPEVITKAELDTICPQTTYTYSISGGTLGTQSATLVVPADAYSSQVPAVDSATYSALTALLPQDPVNINTVAHPAGAGTNYSATYLSLQDVDDNGNTIATMNNTDGSNSGIASLQIDGGTLLPAHHYKVSIDYTDRVVTNNAGFGTAYSFVAFEQNTELSFETLLADGGSPDAGIPDDGGVDAGDDAGLDAGSDGGVDMGGDAGSIGDAGTQDAGTQDAGVRDAGPVPGGSESDGCACSSIQNARGALSNGFLAAAVLGWFWTRRRTRKS